MRWQATPSGSWTAPRFDDWEVGNCYYELRSCFEALNWFRCAESLLPDDPTPIGLQADALHAQGDATEAERLYQKARIIDPDEDLAIKNWNRWLRIERAAEPQNEPDK